MSSPLESLRASLLTALTDAIHAAFGPLELPPLELGLPPGVELGDLSLGTFPLAKPLRKPPPLIARELATRLSHPALEQAVAVGPYLNLTLRAEPLFTALLGSVLEPGLHPFGHRTDGAGRRVMVEYSSPNTNKPLHIGHVRNNLLGHSVSKLLQAVGYEVVQACLVNDRGIHICKSMLAYLRFFADQSPASRGQKGDHFVGDCYVAYEQALQQERNEIRRSLEQSGLTGDALDAAVDARSPMVQETREMLRKWEAGDPSVRALWKLMNQWVYDGFAATYRRLGIAFDVTYTESTLYQKGREQVLEALEQGIVQRRSDGAVVIDLSEEKLDNKVLLRSDGTSLYITQDIGVARQKWEDYQPDRSIYVIANEQDHQMKVLFLTLKKLGLERADGLFHLSYGMVNLPEGRMKSREGKVVDADDLLLELYHAADQAQAPRKTEESLPDSEWEARAWSVALGGIKFFFLKPNPRKDFMFDPEESISLQGDTGPYVQYTHARIKSILRKARVSGEATQSAPADLAGLSSLEERAVARALLDFPRAVQEAADRLLPSTLCTYLLDLAAAFNRFYHVHRVLNADDPGQRAARLQLSAAVATVLASGLELLGIQAPEAM